MPPLCYWDERLSIINNSNLKTITRAFPYLADCLDDQGVEVLSHSIVSSACSAIFPDSQNISERSLKLFDCRIGKIRHLADLDPEPPDGIDILVKTSPSTGLFTLHQEIIKRKAIKDSSVVNKWYKAGLITSLPEIIKTIKVVHKAKLPGRVISIYFRHILRGYTPLEKIDIKKLNIFGVDPLKCPLCLGKDGLTYDHLFHFCEITRIIREQIFEAYLVKYGHHVDTRSSFACFRLDSLSPSSEIGLLLISVHVVFIYQMHKFLFSGQLSTLHLNSTHPEINLVKLINECIFTINKLTKFSAGQIYKLKLHLNHLWSSSSLPASRYPNDIDPAHKSTYAGGRKINLGPNTLTLLRDLAYGPHDPG